MNIEEFNTFASWWLSKREYAEKIAEEICQRSPEAIFISNRGDGKNWIGFTYYPYDDERYTETEHFPSEWLFDPNAVEKAKARRKEDLRQAAIRREEQNTKEKRERMARAKYDYERLKAEFDAKFEAR
jgi:hypothetical protein